MSDSEYSDKRAALLADLREMSRGQLHSLLADVFASYRVIQYETGDVDDVICIASVSAVFNDGPPYIQCWAFPDESENYMAYKSVPVTDVGQLLTIVVNGMCERCGVSVVATKKIAKCPSCDYRVECT